MLEAYKEYWTGYVDFKGATGRKNFWLAVLMTFIVTFVLTFIVQAIFGSDIYTTSTSMGIPTTTFNLASGAGIIMACWSLVNLLPGLAMEIRRLHDLDKSGWWVLLSLIPIVGPIILLVWYCTKGKK